MRRTVLFLLALVLDCLSAGPVASQCTVDEDFSSTLAPVWNASDPTAVDVVDGALDIRFRGAAPTDVEYAELADCVYDDFVVTYRCRDLDGTVNKTLGFRTHGGEPRLGYSVNFRSDPFNDVVLSKGPAGNRTWLRVVPFEHVSGEWIDVRIEVSGDFQTTILVHANGEFVMAYADVDPYPSGAVYLFANAGGILDAHAQFDDFAIEANNAVSGQTSSWGGVKARF